MVDESHDEGMLDESEYERLAGALGFTSRTVDVGAAAARRARDRAPRGPRHRRRGSVCARPATPASRWSATTAQLVGYLHIKDVLAADPHGRARVVEDKWIRPFADVRPSDTLVSARRRSRPRARTWPTSSTTRAGCSGS